MSFNKGPLSAALSSSVQFFRVIVTLSGFVALVTSTENYFTTNSEQFSSVPTTVKTYENDTVLLPCYTVGEFLNYGNAVPHAKQTTSITVYGKMENLN